LPPSRRFKKIQTDGTMPGRPSSRGSAKSFEDPAWATDCGLQGLKLSPASQLARCPRIIRNPGVSHRSLVLGLDPSLRFAVTLFSQRAPIRRRSSFFRYGAAGKLACALSWRVVDPEVWKTGPLRTILAARSAQRCTCCTTLSVPWKEW
jgi:hypothetical protein